MSGKSATFPVHGRVNSRFHKPGESIFDEANTARAYQDAVSTGAAGDGRPQAWTADTAATYLSNPGSTEKTININDLLLASVFIDDLDEAKAHYDLRSAYTEELGRALARKLDNLSIRALAQSAAGTADGPMGAVGDVTDANIGTQADVMASGIITAAQLLDEQSVPAEERFCILDPAGYYLLLRAAGGIGATDSYAALLSQDYSMGNGDFAEGRVLMVAGVPVVVSTNTGFGVDFTTTDAGESNSLGVNMTKFKGLVGHKTGAGVAKLKDLQLESDYNIERQGHLFVSKLACGVAPLRTDSVVALKTP